MSVCLVNKQKKPQNLKNEFKPQNGHLIHFFPLLVSRWEAQAEDLLLVDYRSNKLCSSKLFQFLDPATPASGMFCFHPWPYSYFCPIDTKSIDKEIQSEW